MSIFSMIVNVSMRKYQAFNYSIIVTTIQNPRIVLYPVVFVYSIIETICPGNYTPSCSPEYSLNDRKCSTC